MTYEEALAKWAKAKYDDIPDNAYDFDLKVGWTNAYDPTYGGQDGLESIDMDLSWWGPDNLPHGKTLKESLGQLIFEISRIEP